MPRAARTDLFCSAARAAAAGMLALLCGCLDFHALRERAADPDGGSIDSGARDGGPDAAPPSTDAGADGGDRGGSGGRDGPTAGAAGEPGESRPPLAALDFPRSGATARDRIRVRGSARDPGGDAITVLTVTTGAGTVDALEALQPDGSFIAEVELAQGAQTIELAIEDERGARASTTAGPIERTAHRFGAGTAAVLDPAGERALAVDGHDMTLVAIDLENGEREVLAAGSAGIIDAPVDLALDGAGERVLVVDPVVAALRAVSLEDGASTPLTPEDVRLRRVVIDADHDRALVLRADSPELAAVPLTGGPPEALDGDGPALEQPHDLAVDLARNRAIVSDPGIAALVAVDLDTGTRWLLSGDGRGHGPALEGIRDLVIDAARDRALVVQARDGRHVIFEVQLDSGDRRLAADLELGGDPPLRSRDARGGPALFYDSDREALFVLSDEGRLAAVHLEPGTRRIVADSAIGAGPDIPIAALGWGGAAQRALVIGGGGLYTVDPVSGDRALVSSAARGSGPEFGSLYAVAGDGDGDDGAAWVLSSQGLFRVALESGDRERRSGTGAGSGPALGFGVQLLLDSARNRAIAVAGNTVHDLVAIALDTGDRSVLASASAGTGPAIDFDAVVRDPSRDRLLAVGDDKLVAVDATTGDRTLIADDDRGEGPDFGALVSLALDPYADRVLVVDAGNHRVLAVDPETGDRTVVTGPGAGEGPLSLTVLGQLAVDEARGQLLLVDGDKLLAVELIARGRTVVSDQLRGELRATGMVRDATRRDALVVADGANPFAVLHLDLSSGDREPLAAIAAPAWALRQGRERDEWLLLETPVAALPDSTNALYRASVDSAEPELLASADRGDGPLGEPRDVAWDAARERIVLADAALEALLAIDPATGTRTVVSDADTGEGPALAALAALCIDGPRDRALAISDRRVIAIDLETGERALAAESGPGDAELVHPIAIACDADGERAFIADGRQLAALDFASGELTFHPLPLGAPLAGPQPPATLELDPQLQVLYVLQTAIPNALFAVDLVTFEHVLLAGSGP